MQIPRRDLSSNAQTAQILKEMGEKNPKKDNSNEWIQHEKKIDPWRNIAHQDKERTKRKV